MELYQCHIRSWETSEYETVYVMADSIDMAFDLMEPFRATHQCKTVCPEGHWIADEALGQSHKSDARFDPRWDNDNWRTWPSHAEGVSRPTLPAQRRETNA